MPAMTAHRERSIRASVAARPASPRTGVAGPSGGWLRSRIIRAREVAGRRREPWPASPSSPIPRPTSIRPRPQADGHPRSSPLVGDVRRRSFRAGVDLSTAEFWERMTAPDAPFPKTAASSPGEFKAVYDGVFAEGADAIVSVHVAGSLSGAMKSAEIAQVDAARPRRSTSSTRRARRWPRAILCLPRPRDGQAGGCSAEEIAGVLNRPRRRPPDVRLARDARVPQEGRPDQRRPGGDRDAALGQADHRGRGRRRRDGRQAADAGEVARALHRADHAPGRSSGSRSSTRWRPTSTSSRTR